MKDSFIITAAPGAGKTTILPVLQPILPAASAVLDGDALGRIHPWSLSRFWLDLVQDNILACASVFMRNGIDHLVAAFCLPSSERLQRLSTGLMHVGYSPTVIGLFVNEDELRRRHVSRGASYPEEDAMFRSCIDLNESIKELRGIALIDISEMSVAQAARAIRDVVLEASARADTGAAEARA